jgi:hypothetical protein
MTEATETPENTARTIIESWNDLIMILPNMTEEALRVAINYEASTYKRKAILCKMHQRYAKLNTKRIRDGLLAGELLL